MRSPNRSRVAIAAVAIAAILASPLVAALGLGGSIGNPILLQSLHIEIPLLLSSEETPPRLDCVRIAPAADGADTQFFPKNTKLALDLSATPRLIITSAQTVREPFYEFRIALGCNGEIARDYLVLTRLAEPREVSEPPSASAASIAATVVTLANNPAAADNAALLGSKFAPSSTSSIAPSAPVSSQPTGAKTAPTSLNQSRTGNTLRTLTLKRDSTLNLLARGRYPSNQDTRDEYRRIMALANPALFADTERVGSVPLPAGTVLTIPSNLPPPEHVSSATPNAPVATPGGQTKPAPESAAKSSVKAAATDLASHDRLVIGGDAGGKSSRPISAKEATATIERLELMLLAQATEEREVTEKLKSLETLFADTKTQLQFLEAKSKQQAADQRQLQAKFDAIPEPRAFGVLELLALIVVGGAVGAALLALSHRQQLRRETYANSLTAARNQTTIEPHAIFASTSETPAGETDDEILPFSKSVAPSSSGSGTVRRSNLGSAFAPSNTAPSTPSTKPLATPQPPTPSTVPAQRPPATAPIKSPSSAEVMPTSAPAVKREPVVDHGIAFTLPATFAIASTAKTKENAPNNTALPAINFALDLDSAPRADRTVTSMMDVDIVRKIAASEIPVSPHDAGNQVTEGTEVVFDLAPRTHAEIEVAMAIERELAAKPQATVAEMAPSESAEDPAVELANIMISMGMGDHAEQTLIDYILEDPKRDLGPWLKALEIYRKSGRRSEFEELAISLRKNLNVAPDAWDAVAPLERPTLEGFSRVSETVQRLWPSPETSAYLASLLGDNRDGSRAGFPQAVAEEILWLMRILKVHRELD